MHLAGNLVELGMGEPRRRGATWSSGWDFGPRMLGGMLGGIFGLLHGIPRRLMVDFGGIVAACRLVLGDRAFPRPMVVYT